MLVSIIMPTFNAEGFVSETINSVLRQDYTHWELLIIDDCSTDNTLNIISEYSNIDNRIRVFPNEVNLGAGGSRNVGLSNANGRFLAFLDSDDIWSGDKLTKHIRFMIDNKAGISHTSFSFVDCNGVPKKGRVRVSDKVSLVDNLKRTEIGTSTAMIDRSVVTQDFKFKKIRARQDLQLWIDLLGCGYFSYGLDEFLTKYRVREGSVSSNKWRMLVVTFKLYMKIDIVPFHKRLFCYFSYVINAIKKRQE